MELKTVDEALQRCARAELPSGGVEDDNDENGNVPRANIIARFQGEMQARRRALFQLQDAHEAAQTILDDSLGLVKLKKAASGDEGTQGGKLAPPTLCEQAARVRATVARLQEELTAGETELHTCRERLGGFERRKNRNKDLQALNTLVETELTEALEKCGRPVSPPGGQDGEARLLEKAKRINSSLGTDFVKMSRTHDAALRMAADMLLRSGDVTQCSAAAPTSPEPATSSTKVRGGGRGAVSPPPPSADLLSMLVQVRVLVERLGRIPQLQGELEIINVAASRALSVAGAAHELAHKGPVDKVNLLAGIVLDSHSPEFAWNPTMIMTQRLREIRLLSKDALAASVRDGAQGGVSASTGLGSGGRGAASAARVGVGSVLAENEGVGRPYPLGGARWTSALYRGPDGWSVSEAGDGGQGQRVAGVLRDGEREGEGEAEAALAEVRAVCGVIKEIDEAASDALGVAYGPGSMRCVCSGQFADGLRRRGRE